MSGYTQGVCQDGAAILKDGQPMTIEEILAALNESERLAEMVDRAHAALNELLHGCHMNIGEPGYQIAKRGIWGDMKPSAEGKQLHE